MLAFRFTVEVANDASSSRRRRGLVHDSAHVGDVARAALIPEMEVQPPKAGHSGRIDDADHEVRVVNLEMPVERERSVGQST